DVYVQPANGCKADSTMTIQMLKDAYVRANAASATEITTATNENMIPYAYSKDGEGNVDKVYDECGTELSFFIGLTAEEEKTSVDVSVSLDDDDSYVYWTMKDASGNASRCSTLVSPKDTTKPEIVQSLDTLKLDGSDPDSKCQGVSDLSYNAISNMLNISDCSKTEISYVIIHEDGTKTSAKKVENDAFYKFKETLNDGDVIEWIATDEFQNSNSVKQDVEIVDKKAPKVDCDKLIKNIEITQNELTAGICIDNDYLINHKGLFTGLKSGDDHWVKDNCTDFSDIIVTSKRSDGKNNGDHADLTAPFMVGSTTINWTFADKAGNSDFCPQIINIPNNPPAIVCEPSEVKVPITRENDCNTSYKIEADKVIADLRRGVLIEKGIIDADGNILNGMTEDQVDDLLHKSDCGNDLKLESNVDVPLNPDGSFTFEIGKDVVVTYRVYDEYGNESFCTITYKAVDEEKPYVSKEEFVSTLLRDANCQYVYSNTKSDFLNKLDAADCSNMKVYYEIDGVKTELTDKMTYTDFDSEIGSETIKWTIEDVFGNYTEVTEKISKEDRLAPSVACPTDPIKIPLDGDCKSYVSMSDEQIIAMMRAGAVLPAFNEESLKKVMGIDLYDTLNEAEKFAVTHDCGETVRLLVNDGDDSFVEKEEIVVDMQYGETVTMEFAVRDLSGNENKCSLTFMAIDTTAPKITSLDTVRLYYTESECKCTYSETYEEIEKLLNIRDCDKNTTISYTSNGVTRALPKGEKFDMTLLAGEVNDIVWTVTDGSGNSSSEIQTVVAYDTIAPKFDCSTLAKDLTVVLRNHGDEATFDKFEKAGLDTSIYFDDSCDERLKPTFIRDDDKNVFKDIYPANDTTILYTTFVDKASNSHYCEQNLIVLDSIKPVIICPRDYDTLTCDDKLPYIAKNLDEFKTYLYGDVLDAHNMIPDKFTHEDEFVGDKCESTLTRTYTIYDIFGGSSSCVNKIHVKDNIPPVWTSRLDADTLFFTCDDQSPVYELPKASDACSNYTSVLSTVTSDRVMDKTKCGYYNYNKTFKCYAIDGCGNVNHDSITFVLAIRDTNKPKFDVPDWFVDGEVTAKSDGKCEMLVPDLQPFALNWNDPCSTISALTFSQSPAAGTAIKSNTDVQMILTDACGNSFTIEKEITVPKRDDIVLATAVDFVKCEGSELDVKLMSDTIITAAGKVRILQEDNTYKEVEADVVFDVYKDSISVPTLVYSNNKTTFGLRFSSDPDKVAQYTAIDKLTQTGTYYYVAQDLNTGCTDTASAYIGIRQRPRVAMSSVDTVEACEYQALAVNGMAGDYKEILNVCVEDMGSEIIEEGWIIGGAKYNGEPISHVHDGSRMLYYAVNECGMTSSDSSLAWSCEYVYNRENGTFESKLTTEQMLKDTVSNGAPMKVHQKINPDSMLLTARFEGRPRVWVGENVNLDMKSIYKDKGIEYHWYKVVGDMDASSQMFDGYGNVLEDYINPLDEADELLTVSSIFDSDFGTYFYENLLDTTLFYVVVTDNVCTSAASNVVKVDAYDFIPTAITPHNSKDMNDVFMPGFQVEIFNRYGNKVFEGNDGWDGKIRGVLADPTVYYYVITMKD
ncbi:MAG: gliding motility-associated C-terminal domain-containing protein, partial [Paludibacteraceae bacterium]|nr:gliding motility-associated C-terminal domain-containing protein [Paludibacteraceae bacterium]